jgi:hypothetical protein
MLPDVHPHEEDFNTTPRKSHGRGSPLEEIGHDHRYVKPLQPDVSMTTAQVAITGFDM